MFLKLFSCVFSLDSWDPWKEIFWGVSWWKSCKKVDFLGSLQPCPHSKKLVISLTFTHQSKGKCASYGDCEDNDAFCSNGDDGTVPCYDGVDGVGSTCEACF